MAEGRERLDHRAQEERSQPRELEADFASPAIDATVDDRGGAHAGHRQRPRDPPADAPPC